MRVFTPSQSRLAALPFPMKLIFMAFVFFAAWGMASGLYLGIQKAGLYPEQVAAYYRGDGLYTYPKTKIELLEVTHFHALGMGVLFLIIAHLMLMTACSRGLIMSLIGIAAISLAGVLIGPWLVTYVSPWAAGLVIVSNGLFAGSLALMSGLEVYDVIRKVKK